jgi:signal transduction histidine kinase/CheY-like chemotaxis protein
VKERDGSANTSQVFSLQSPNMSGQAQSFGSLSSGTSSSGAVMQELATAFSALLSCAEHQKMIVDNVLHASKLDAHKVVVERALYAPAKMVRAVVQMFTPLVAQKGLSVRTDVHVPETLLVVGDEARCRQVLINFLSNAVKYTQQGSITIQLRMLPSDAVVGPVQSDPNPFALLPSSSTEASKFPFLPPRQSSSPTDNSALKDLWFSGSPQKSGDERQIRDCQLQFSVIDTGPGMSDEESQALFQRFCRLGQSSNQDYASFGLGLSISRELVNLMGGRISVESHKGHGSTFSFTVRCSAFTDAHGIVLDPQIRQTMEKPGTWVPPELPILVVEDNPLNQVILKRMLLQLGCKAEVAGDGAEAVDVFAARPFAAVLMDVEMPRMSGLDASRCIREMERRMEMMTGARVAPVPIIGLSGNAREEQRAEALQCGMNDYLTKPVRKPDLFQALQQAHFRTADITTLMARSVMVETSEFSLESFRAELIAGTRKRRAAPLSSDRG